MDAIIVLLVLTAAGLFWMYRAMDRACKAHLAAWAQRHGE